MSYSCKAIMLYMIPLPDAIGGPAPAASGTGSMFYKCADDRRGGWTGNREGGADRREGDERFDGSIACVRCFAIILLRRSRAVRASACSCVSGLNNPRQSLFGLLDDVGQLMCGLR